MQPNTTPTDVERVEATDELHQIIQRLHSRSQSEFLTESEKDKYCPNRKL